MSIETERLAIQSPEPCELDSAKAIGCDPRVRRYIGRVLFPQLFERSVFDDLALAATDYGSARASSGVWCSWGSRGSQMRTSDIVTARGNLRHLFVWTPR